MEDFPVMWEKTMLETLGMRLKESSPERLVITMPVGPATHTPAGLLHGGASVALAESVASYGTVLNIDRVTQQAVGLEINANHLRRKADGIVTAVGVPIHRTRSTMVWDIKIYDEEEQLICISRCTMAIIKRKNPVVL